MSKKLISTIREQCYKERLAAELQGVPHTRIFFGPNNTLAYHDQQGKSYWVPKRQYQF